MDFSSLPSILTPDPGLLIWMLFAFLVVYIVLAKYGFPAITGMVEKRKAYIDESLQKAHEASLRLDNIKQESEKILQEAREKQASILKEANATREAIVEKAQEAAREESSRIISEAKAEIEAEKHAAISELRKQVAVLSVEVSEKVLRDKLSTDDAQMNYIDLMLKEVNCENL